MKKLGKTELHRRVDEVLFYVWDPIGVSDEPCARGEYLDYVPEVLASVESSDKPEPIAEILAEIAKKTMELTVDKTKCLEVATLLLRHKQAIKDGLA